MDAAELAAREAIRDLVGRYAHAADGGRFDALAALFTTDGALHLPEGREARGRDAIRAFLSGARTDLRAATATALVRHHVSNLVIDVASPTAATGAAYFLVVTERGPDHWGRYRDTYAVEDGRWRFRARTVRLDGCAPGSWAAERRARP